MSSQGADTRLICAYVWHCHFLDHADNAMMRPTQVV
jgi:FtsP/CotA-like multicopper oxidase with cupredoxin domain